jgi:hypothetical protein
VEARHISACSTLYLFPTKSEPPQLNNYLPPPLPAIALCSKESIQRTSPKPTGPETAYPTPTPRKSPHSLNCKVREKTPSAKTISSFTATQPHPRNCPLHEKVLQSFPCKNKIELSETITQKKQRFQRDVGRSSTLSHPQPRPVETESGDPIVVGIEVRKQSQQEQRSTDREAGKRQLRENQTA